MRIVVQRVKSASVTVEDKVVSSIGNGIMALVGIHEDDSQQDLEYCCKRLLAAKLWENESGPWRHGIKTKGYQLLCVSQFTLYGTLTKKNQPDYKRSMKAIPAEAMYNQFLEMLRQNYEAEKVLDGVFGAYMDVALVRYFRVCWSFVHMLRLSLQDLNFLPILLHLVVSLLQVNDGPVTIVIESEPQPTGSAQEKTAE